MKKIIVIAILLISANALAMDVASSSFYNRANIPKKYTCDAENISPNINWWNVPAGVKSFAVICEDPDSPSGTWTHWVIFNIPPTKKSLPENTPQSDKLADGSIQGTNSFDKNGYGGPCPPKGKPHRYIFRLFALDSMLQLDSKAKRDDVLSEVRNHTIAETRLIGYYGR